MKNLRQKYRETLYTYRNAGSVVHCKHSLRFYVYFFLVLSIGYLISPVYVAAQEGQLSVTIAPPIFQLNLQPGESWSSGITVVNNNQYDTKLYAETMLFEPTGESGRPVFIAPPSQEDNLEGTQESTLAGWITVPQEGFTIAREQTYVLPVVIQVPEDAQPGGHYAAILIGNKAPEGSVEGGTVNVTSSIASLIFLSVAGEVHEKGQIKDFSTQKYVYEKPEAQLSLRFENQGNVHILPQGNIVIYNMFGVERGVIPVNHSSGYGNVLPGSVRKFSFNWESETGLWDIGRYRAEATIHYGKEQKKTALSTTYFYVLPVMPILYIVGAVLALMFFFTWSVKAYIRRALTIQAQQHLSEPVRGAIEKLEKVEQRMLHEHQISQKTNIVTLNTLLKPIQTGLIDLHNAGVKKEQNKQQVTDLTHIDPDRRAFEERLIVEQNRAKTNSMSLIGFLKEYRAFFIFVAVLAIIVFAINVFLDDVLTIERDYSVEEIRTQDNVRIHPSPQDMQK